VLQSSVAAKMEAEMNKTIRWCLPVVLVSVALAGCGTFTMDNPMTKEADTKKMAQVETVARRTGVEVHWINYPQKSPQQ
jgi:outer membrane PBP1 activator LpoA protein